MATSVIEKSLASDVNTINDTLNNKSTQVSTGWGTTLSWTAYRSISILCISRNLLAVVWTPSTEDISIIVFSASGNYTKGGTTSLQFGVTSDSTTYTITRDGNEITVTAQTNNSMKAFT